MLSKTERNYLSGIFNPNKNYEYKIIHSIRKKLKILSADISLIESKPEALSAVGAQLGKLTSYQTKLTPLRWHSLIMIKYLD
uniref:Uncharacterized protein n=1 Tax=uncultured marine crenarchaeote HF4000_APKG6D9 TaxID=455597 RepID=B3T944_9ARCH|nr:hypothetical protein ALOHA_HF4000APKG6D9ctg2g8 [uncultured marine crenarchaeote HF4000_APKG6D9]